MKRPLIITGLILIIFLTFCAFKVNQFYQSIYKKNTNVKKIVNKTAYTFLLLGYGGGIHEGTYLTDSMILVHIDLGKKKVLLTSIPRDIWVKLPTKSGQDFSAKINSVYQLDLFPKTYPDIDLNYPKKKGYSNLISLVLSQITGFQVDGYLAIDFSGFTKAIDTLDGIDIDIKKAFEDPQYPIDGKETDLCGKDKEFDLIKNFITPPFNEEEKKKTLENKPDLEKFLTDINEKPEEAFPCRYEKLVFKTGLTHMDGATALKYVRSRHGIEDGGDFGRASRQQQFILAVKNKIISLGFIPKIIPLMEQMKKEIKTDISYDLVKKILQEAPNANKYSSVNLVLSTDNYLIDTYSEDGQYILIPKEGENNWSELKKNLINIIAGITPTPIKKTNVQE